MRSRALQVLALLFLLLAIGVAWLWQQRRPPALATEKLVIAANTEYVGACAVVAAQQRGYFAAQGLQVQVLPFSSGKASLQAVVEGKADVATVADIPIVFAAMDGLPVKVLATLFRSGTDHGIVGRRDHGVVTPASLKGKRIGVTQGTSGHFTLDVFLNWQRMEGRDVTMVNYKPEELGQALQRGEVDAISGWEPFLGATRKQLGDAAVAFSGEQAYESIYNLVALRRYTTEHPAVIQRALQALHEASAYCERQPQAVHGMLPATARLERAEVLAAWPSYHFGLELDQSLLLALEDRARWAIRNRLAASREMPNFLDNMYLDGLAGVRPSAVTVIH
ncbi:ABC transporter substrate-binding protein [Pseudoduganella sp.]|uniref:ABC transporter substrate-binding protein n=1 Tax=Pseudoduganella sp. TaxID=1880898 RepID=UPI0035AD7C2C